MKKGGDYVELFQPKGYTNNREITNTDSRFLVTPSQNVMVINKEKVVSRKGYTLKGVAGTENKSIKGSYDWDTSDGKERSVRSWGTKLEVWHDSAWLTLKSGYKSVGFQFATWWDGQALIDLLLFVDGTDGIHSWSGGISKVAAVTSNTITKQGIVTGTGVSFVADNGDGLGQIVDSAALFVTNGFVVGNSVEVTGSGNNDGIYTVSVVEADTLTLTEEDSIETEASGADITVQDTIDGEYIKARFDATSGKVLIGGTEYSYTGITDGKTLTGVTPNPVANVAVGDYIMSEVKTENPASIDDFEADIISMLNNHVFIGSTKRREVFMSKSNDYTDFGYTTPLRKPTEGFEILIDDSPNGFIPDEDTMYIAAGKDDFYGVTFTLNADQQGESISIDKLKTSLGQAAVNQGVIVHIKNNVAFLSFEPTVDTLGRVQNIDTEQSVPISDDIRDLLESLDSTNAHGFYHQRNLYFTFPNDGVVLIYDTRYSYWQPPQILPIARFALIDNKLCGHSSVSNETYVLFDGFNDNGAKFRAVAAFGYENYGARFSLKNFDELAAEVRISRTTELIDRVLFEEDGSSGLQEFPINADNPQQVFSKEDDASLGKAPLGNRPNGSLITSISELVKVKVINTLRAVDFFERQRIFESDSEDVQFEILAYGENVTNSGNEPDFIKN